MVQLDFHSLVDGDVRYLWDHGHARHSWPSELYSLDLFLRLAKNGEVSNFLGEGEQQGIWWGKELCGFASLHQIGAEHLPQGTTAMEGGTYLLPEYRGRGLNRFIKRYLLKRTFEVYQGDWCVFVISTLNSKALRAMQKLNWPFQQLDATTTSHPLARYRKWKAWKTGAECILFALPRQDYHRVKSRPQSYED